MERLAGVDAVRGLAVLGMFAAHVGHAGDGFWSSTGWLVVADGRSSATFATLAGLSMALMSGGRHPRVSEQLGPVRARIVARAVVVAVIGYVLVALGTPIYVILPAYAAMFVLTLPFLAATPTTLALAALGFAAVGPLLVTAAGGKGEGLGAGPVGLLLTGYYPAAVWLAYVLAGLAVGRLDLRDRGIRVALALAGCGLALTGYGLGVAASAGAPGLAAWSSVEPHADTTLEVVGNLGVAVLLVAGVQSLAETRLGRILLSPVAATGALALTVYTAQIVAIALMGPDVVYEQTTNGTLVAFTVVTLTACTLWVHLVGRGPLERLMRTSAAAFAAPRTEHGARP